MTDINSEWSDAVAFSVTQQKMVAWEILEMQQFLNNEPTANHSFGWAVSLNSAGDNAVISSYRNGAILRGTVYHFVKTNGIWEYYTKIVPGSGEGLGFGTALALNGAGDSLLVGTQDGVGHVYHYQLENSMWVKKQDFYDPQSGGSSEYAFGTAIAISDDGTLALIGAKNAPYSGFAERGCVHVYTHNGTSWSLQKTINNVADYTHEKNFGKSLAISGDGTVAAIGYNEATGGAGHVAIFGRVGTTWSRKNDIFYNGETFVDNISVEYSTQLGFADSIAMNQDGRILFVNYYQNNNLLQTTFGLVATYVRIYDNYVNVGECHVQPKLDDVSNNKFGFAVATNGVGDVLLATCPYSDDVASNAGSVYFFDTAMLPDHLVETQTVFANPPVGSGFFGRAVASSETGDVVLVGSIGDDVGGTNTGSVYYFGRQNGVFTQQGKITAAIPVANDYFGSSVAINPAGDFSAIGAIGAPALDAVGAVYLFQKVNSVWTQLEKITPPAIDGWDWGSSSFGASIALNAAGTEMLIGCPTSRTAFKGCVLQYLKVDGIWTYTSNFTIADNTAYGARFGSSIALSGSGNKALVGAMMIDYGAEDAGAVFICTKLNGEWTVGEVFYPGDSAYAANFGFACAVSSDFRLAAIGAQAEGDSSTGAVYLYTLDSSPPVLRRKIKQSDLADVTDTDFFGSSVAFTKNATSLFVGAQNREAIATNINHGGLYEFVSINQ